jgi:hypothetical protein
MVTQVEEWQWSSYLAMCQLAEVPEWLETDWILSQFSQNRAMAIRQYSDFVRAGVGQPSIWSGLRKQIFMGSDNFIETMVKTVEQDKRTLQDVPRIQVRALPKTLDKYSDLTDSRNEAIKAAFNSGGFTMKEIGDYFGLHYTSVSRIVNKDIL